jgi:hypothetical protein
MIARATFGPRFAQEVIASAELGGYCRGWEWSLPLTALKANDSYRAKCRGGRTMQPAGKAGFLLPGQ